MASKRMIDAGIWDDEFIGSLGFFERILWIGLFSSCADDQGRFQWIPAIIRSKIFPYDDIPLSDIEKVLEKFESAGRIMSYNAEGKRLGQIVNWWDHQSPSWAMPSKYPPPPGWVDRVKYHQTPKNVITLNWDKPGGFPQSELLPNTLHSGLGSVLGSKLDSEPGNGLSRGIDKIREEGVNAPVGAGGDDPPPPEPPEDDLQPAQRLERGLVKNPRALEALASHEARRAAGAYDWAWLAEHLVDLGKAFVEAAGEEFLPQKFEHSGWKKFLGEQFDLGLSPPDIKAAVKYCRANGLTVKGPQSVTGIARDLRARRRAAAEEVFWEEH